ncbi:MAG: uroporphyrinogen-III synthase, partial [Chloroflexota bacterium]|nr:uroporphyrinogen-III synthase [Chloroflexota bacterium]
RLAAIGPATADALAGHRLSVDFVPDQYVAESIVDGIGDVRGQRILLPRADIARRALVEGLEARGAEVQEVTAYRTLPANPGDLKSLLGQEPAIDIATFTSPSTVHNFVALLEDGLIQHVLGRAVVACIGPITARAAQAEGLRVDIVATEHTTSGLLQAIVGYVEEREREL